MLYFYLLTCWTRRVTDCAQLWELVACVKYEKFKLTARARTDALTFTTGRVVVVVTTRRSGTHHASWADYRVTTRCGYRINK